MVRLEDFVDCEPEKLGIKEKVRYLVLSRLMDKYEGKELLEKIRENNDNLIPKHITPDDVFASVNYLNCLAHGIGEPDDIDHLGNRRMRSVGELLQNQFRVGFSRMGARHPRKNDASGSGHSYAPVPYKYPAVTAAIKEFSAPPR
jgi:DNA-directed RNA polymerase subunit beta